MAYTEFYVAKGALAADINGGGPRKGAQDAPIYNSADTTSDVPGTSITDNLAQWTGCQVDDWLCFDTAGGKEFARITAIAAAVATVSPAVTGSQATKDTVVGGAWSSVQHAADKVASTWVNAASDPPRVNIDAAAAFAEDIDLQQAGTLASPVTFQGYTATAGDGGMAEIDGDGLANHDATWDGNGQTYIILRDLYIHGDQAGIEGIRVLGAYCLIDRCKLKTTGAAHTIEGNGNHLRVINTWIEDSGASGINVSAYAQVDGCRVDSTASVGIKLGPFSSAVGNVVNDAGAGANHYGIHSDGDVGVIAGNSVYNSADSGIFIDDLVAEGHGVVINNVLEECGQNAGVGYGIEVEAADKYLQWAGYNAYYNNKDGESLNILHEVGAVTLTASPFTNAAGNDFSLNNTAGAGAACREAGFPGALIDGSHTGYRDIGALQHQDAGGGVPKLAGEGGGLVG